MDILWYHYLLFAAISFVPVVFWMWFFLEEKKEPRSLACFTFFLGAFSVLPLLLYQQIFLKSDNWWVSNVTNKLHLGSAPGLDELLQFLALFGLIAVFTFVVAMVLVLFGTFFQRQNLGNTFKSVFQEMGNFSLLGVFAVILVIFLHWQGVSLVGALSLTLLLAAFEEYSKHLIVRFTDDDKFKSIDDAIIFSALVGLGFAFTENILVYFPNAWEGGNFMRIVVLRSILLVFAHALFSGIFGYYYGIGHFSKPLLVEKIVNKPRSFFLNSIHKFLHLKSEPTFREKRMMEGLIIATAMHTAFNLFMKYNMLLFGTGVVIVGGIIFFYLIEKKEHRKKYGLIGTRWVPNEMEFMEAMNAVRDAKTKEGLDPDDQRDRSN